MKHTLTGICALIALVWGYTLLPVEWRRHKDIDLGNTLIARIDAHLQQHGHLPEPNETNLQQLGFRHDKDIGWQPSYRIINGTHYRIVYQNGYAPPWLGWDSQQRVWQLQGQQP
ncbi:hypothetical protein [Conchiformibius kuhniae]|uniref:Uncharacterized protein n=1 Tax=Conchiformibius kuhniae TaxID=211502 RepID=A0A8T9MUT5_9NEIS|nr:hypothetical protein [Conchiformibius kuhniae]UOP04884.1 hypothetical protein LVJ77_00465 [Conchiformibius kuhniae]